MPCHPPTPPITGRPSPPTNDLFFEKVVAHERREAEAHLEWRMLRLQEAGDKQVRARACSAAVWRLDDERVLKLHRTHASITISRVCAKRYRERVRRIAAPYT